MDHSNSLAKFFSVKFQLLISLTFSYYWPKQILWILTKKVCIHNMYFKIEEIQKFSPLSGDHSNFQNRCKGCKM